MIKDCLMQVLCFLQRVSPTLIQHATSRLYAYDAYLITDFPTATEILPSIDPYLSPHELYHSRFNMDTKLDVYIFFLGYFERLHRLGLADSNRVDFTICKFFRLAK